MKMRVKESAGDRMFKVVNTVLLMIIALIMLYPIWFVIIASVSDPNMVGIGKVLLLPKGFTLNYYKYVLGYKEILLGYRNSLFYMVVGTVLDVIVTAMTAYAISSKRLFGKKIIVWLMLFTMFFNGGLIPTYLMLKQFGLLNRWVTLLFVGMISVYNVIVARTYFQESIPASMLEAAEIDGSGDIRTLFNIVIPVSLPMLAVIALYYASSHWNRYFVAMVYVRDRSKLPLQVFLREILILDQTANMMETDDVQAMKELSDLSRSIQYALIVVASLPLIIAYPFVQRFFVGGVMIGSVKG